MSKESLAELRELAGMVYTPLWPRAENHVRYTELIDRWAPLRVTEMLLDHIDALGEERVELLAAHACLSHAYELGHLGDGSTRSWAAGVLAKLPHPSEMNDGI